MIELRAWAGRWWGIGLTGLLFACGGASQKAEDPSGESALEREARAEALLPPLQPVGAPANVVFRFRARSPEKLLSGAFESAGVPLDGASLADLLRKEVFDTVPASFDFSGPIEGLIVLGADSREEPDAVFTLSARSVTDTVRELNQAGVDVEEGPEGAFYFSYEGQSCAVGRALGPSLARVACGSEERALHRLLPYALRGLPIEQLSAADVYFDLDYRPIRRVYGRQIRSLKLLASVGARQLHIDEARFDRAITDAAVGLAEELGRLNEDFEGFKAEIFEEKGDFRADWDFFFTGSSSWTAQSVELLGRSQGAAPPLFDQIPATATAATYGRALPTTHLEGIRQTLVDLVGGFAQSKKVPRVLQLRMENAMRELLLEPGVSVDAAGPLGTIKKDGKEIQATTWHLWGTTRARANVVTWLDDWGALFASKELAEWLDKPGFLPRLERHKKGLPRVPSATVYRWELPRELVSLAESEQKAQGELGSIEPPLDYWREGYLAVDAIGGATWVAWGASLDELATPLLALKDKNSPRLAGVADLAAFRARPAAAGAFVGVEGLAGYFSPYLGPILPSPVLELLGATPHRGKVPFTYFIEVRHEGPTSLRMSFQVPAAFVTDVTSLVVLGIADSQKTPADAPAGKK